MWQLVKVRIWSFQCIYPDDSHIFFLLLLWFNNSACADRFGQNLIPDVVISTRSCVWTKDRDVQRSFAFVLRVGSLSCCSTRTVNIELGKESRIGWRWFSTGVQLQTWVGLCFILGLIHYRFILSPVYLHTSVTNAKLGLISKLELFSQVVAVNPSHCMTLFDDSCFSSFDFTLRQPPCRATFSHLKTALFKNLFWKKSLAPRLLLHLSLKKPWSCYRSFDGGVHNNTLETNDLVSKCFRVSV